MLNELEGGVGVFCYVIGMVVISSSLFVLFKVGDYFIVS